MSKLTFLGLAEKVLAENTAPMSVEDIWNFAVTKEYNKALNSTGKTPWATMGAQLYVSIRDGDASLFASVGERPKRFYLRSMKDKLDLSTKAASPDAVAPAKSYLESDLHPFIVYFGSLYLRAYCKTIRHSAGKKAEFGEWIHPDIVGCYFPLEDWRAPSIELSQALGASNIRLYSFELKRQLSFGNLREAFFQAVSNSSWANEGYLCAAQISADEEFRAELKRLSGSFGIGIIHIDIEDPDSTEIIFPARQKDSLDWESLNKLCMNKDFSTFINRVKTDLTSKEIRKEQYDEVLAPAKMVQAIKGAK